LGHQQQQQQQATHHSRTSQQQQPQLQSCSSSSACWISLLAHLELPNGIAMVKQILEAAAAPALQQKQGLVMQTALIGLAESSAAGSEQQEQQQQQQQQQQQRVSESSTGDGSAGQQDVWVAWALQFEACPAVDDVTAADSSLGDRLAAAAAAATAAHWKLTVSQPQLTRVAAAAVEGVGSDHWRCRCCCCLQQRWWQQQQSRPVVTHQLPAVPQP